MNDEQLLRYSRQIMLPQLDVEGQEKLLAAHVLIIGLGGLGCPAALYLAGAGVGRLTLADDDAVDLSNLQRQIAHQRATLGQAKVASAAAAVQALNEDVQVRCLHERLQGDALSQAVAAADVVVDATDNFRSRFAINRACVQARVPLVSGAAIRMEGQVSVFDGGRSDAPCYQCLYEEGGSGSETCSENGVIAPLVGIIGSIQALETLKVIAGIGSTLRGRLLIVDGMTLQMRELRLAKNSDCPVCGTAARKA